MRRGRACRCHGSCRSGTRGRGRPDAIRAHRHPGQRGRGHPWCQPQHALSAVGRGAMGRHVRAEPQARLPFHPARRARHARAPRRKDRQRVVGGLCRRRRTSGLRRRQGGGGVADAQPRAVVRAPHSRELHRPRPRPDQCRRQARRERASALRRPKPAAAPGPTRGDRRRGGVPVQRRVVVHDRRDPGRVGRQPPEPVNLLAQPTMQEHPVLAEAVGRVGVITLNLPKHLNALNDALMDALGAALLAFDADDGIGAIVVTGGRKAFAADADIAAMVDWTYMDVYRSDFITRNWETIRRVRKPVIAAVAGYAMGGGCEFALPEVKLAMLPGAGRTQRLPRAIGKAKAMDMCLSARTLDAEEADRNGLVSRVVPDERLRDEALALATTIAGYSAPALMAIKESVNRAYETSLDEGIRFERRQMHSRFAGDDAHEGMKAFLDKRKPVFTHR